MTELSGAIEGAAARAPGSPLRIAAPRAAIPILLALGAALFVVNLGGYPFYTKGEPREAITVVAMVRGGGLILPLRAGVEVPSKPPLMHWMAAAISIAAGGVSEATVRLPSALLAIGGLVLCYLYVRMLFDEQSALLAALILAISFQYLQAGSGARVDMTLTFFMELACFELLAIAEGLSSRWLLLYFALAAAVLAKGPVGAVLPGLAALVWIAYERRWDAIARWRPWFGIPILIAIDGGWYLGAAAVRGPAFVHKQLMAENLYRLFGGGVHEGHAHPFYYLIFALLGGFMPWTLVAPVAWMGYVRREGALAARIRYLLAWCLVVFAVYSAAQSKRGVYLLGMYPALAALFGIALADAAAIPDAAPRAVAAAARAAGLALLAAAAAGAAALAMLARAPQPLAALFARLGWTAAQLMPALTRAAADHRLAAVLLLGAAAAAALALLRRGLRADRMVVAIAGGVAALVVIADLVAIPAIAEATSLRGFTRAALRAIGNQPAAYFGGLDYEVAYYSGRSFAVLGPNDPATTPYLFCWKNIYDALPPRMRARYAVAIASNPTELDGSGIMLLLRRAEP